jgi:glycerophosphoryl diester phosphodiesterase
MAERRFSQDLPRPLVVAHRGASAERPENTLEAFEAAVRAGADAVEFDVRLTRDDHAVVHHDASVDRTTDGRGPIRDLTLAEVAALRVRAPSGEASGVPTLVETLTSLSGRVAVDIEIKNLPGEPDFDPDREAAVEATLRALDETGFIGPVLVSSFNPRSIAWSRRLAPEVPTGLLTIEHLPLTDALALAAGHPWVLPSAAAVLAGDEGWIDAAHTSGLLVGTWIVDDAETAVLLAARGIDAIATNDPVAIVTALGR